MTPQQEAAQLALSVNVRGTPSAAGAHVRQVLNHFRSNPDKVFRTVEEGLATPAGAQQKTVRGPSGPMSYQAALTELTSSGAKHYNDHEVSNVGMTTLNLRFFTTAEPYKSLLADQGFLKWCLAVDVLKDVEETQPIPASIAQHKLTTRISTITNTFSGTTFDLTVGSLLEKAWVHPALFEAVTPNNNTRSLEQYIEKKKHGADAVYRPIAEAVMGVAASLRVVSTPASPLDRPYDPARWTDYIKLFDRLLERIREIPPRVLDTGDGTVMYSEDSGSSAPVRHWGFEALLNELGSVAGAADFATRLATSQDVFLNGGLAHFLWDRFHLTPALRQEAPVQIGDESLTYAQALRKTMELFANGVTAENALAAEQLYLRLRWIQDWYEGEAQSKLSLGVQGKTIQDPSA